MSYDYLFMLAKSTIIGAFTLQANSPATDHILEEPVECIRSMILQRMLRLPLSYDVRSATSQDVDSPPDRCC